MDGFIYYTNVLKLASLFSCQGSRPLPSGRPAGRWGQAPDPFTDNTNGFSCPALRFMKNVKGKTL